MMHFMGDGCSVLSMTFLLFSKLITDSMRCLLSEALLWATGVHVSMVGHRYLGISATRMEVCEHVKPKLVQNHHLFCTVLVSKQLHYVQCIL